MQTKMSKNRGLMAITTLAMLGVVAGLGWNVFRHNATKAPTETTQQTTTAPQSSADAAGVTDTQTMTATEEIPATYTVAVGDTLSSIAAKFYHDGNLYWAIERANLDLVGKRDNLVEGMTLKLPTAADVASAR